MSGCERRPKFTMNIFNRKYASLNENVRNDENNKVKFLTVKRALI